MRLVSLAASLLLAFAHAACAQASASVDVGPLIDRLATELPSVRETLEKLEHAPEPGTFTIWSKDTYRNDLNDLLDEAFELVVPDTYSQTKQAIDEIDKAILLGRKEQSELKVGRAISSSTPKALSLLDRAKGLVLPPTAPEDAEARILALNGEITELERLKAARIGTFSSTMRDMYGLELTDQEAKAALYQVNGERIVDSILVTKVLLKAEDRLKAVLKEGLDQETARKYYGVAVISRLIVVRMHEKHLSDYGGLWLPKLDEIEARNNKEIIAIEKNTVASETEATRKQSAANLRVRTGIATAIKQYRTILLHRREIVETLLRESKKDAEVAVQTLRTLEDAVLLSSVIDDSFQDFTALTDIKALDLLPLSDAEMFDRFLDLSKQLQGS